MKLDVINAGKKFGKTWVFEMCPWHLSREKSTALLGKMVLVKRC